MGSSQRNPSDVDVALSDLAAGTPSSAPGQTAVSRNGGNGSRPVGNGPLMAAEEPPAPQPQPESAPPQPQPPVTPGGQPPAAPAPGQPGAPAPQQPPTGQPPAGAPGYVQGQGIPPQPPPGYPAYAAGYPQQPGGPYERRGLVQAWYEYPALRWLTIILALAIIALLVWLLAFKSNGSSSATVQPGGGPVGATQQDLVVLSQRLNQPIYWAGTIAVTRMELTETSSSYAYLRYLTSDAPVGDSSPNFLTVGTYPSVNAYTNLRAYARHSQAKTERIQNNGIAVVIPKSPTSVYFAYPHQDVQVEVYDPQPNKALDLVKSGQVVPVPGGVTTSNGTASVPSATPPSSATTPVAPASPASPTTTTTPAVPTVPGG
jgi:hypothetical protein